MENKEVEKAQELLDKHFNTFDSSNKVLYATKAKGKYKINQPLTPEFELLKEEIAKRVVELLKEEIKHMFT